MIIEKEIQLTFWTGAGSVTGANFLLESLHTRILVDCGLIQGNLNDYEENKKPFPYEPSSVDFLFLTHAHMDHIGRVGKLVRDGFSGTIYSTLETKELARLMLADAIKVMGMKEVEEGNKPLYDTNDLNKALSLWKTIPYHLSTSVGKDFSVYLKDAGHILGSSMYEFSFHDKKIVFTGDSGNSPSPLLRDSEEITDADYLIMDSVYGDKNHESKEERDLKFKKVILDTIEKKGALVIPAFSIERTQVILYILNSLVEKGEIPQLPIFLDSPLAIKVTEVYKKESENFNEKVKDEIKKGDDIFDFPKLRITYSRFESNDIVNVQNPKIIIAGSGMSSGGRVVSHEINFLPDPNSTVLLMGYQAVGTLGRKIQEKPQSVEINSEIVPIKARIETISGYSSHKDSDGLVEMVSSTADKVKKVFVCLGEPKASTYLVQRLRDELEVDAIYPERGKAYKL